MEEGLFDEAKVGEGKRSPKKVYALVLVAIVLISVVGFLIYSGYGGIMPSMVSVNTPDEAADALSDLGNDLTGLSDDLKDMENLL